MVLFLYKCGCEVCVRKTKFTIYTLTHVHFQCVYVFIILLKLKRKFVDFDGRIINYLKETFSKFVIDLN